MGLSYRNYCSRLSHKSLSYRRSRKRNVWPYLMAKLCMYGTRLGPSQWLQLKCGCLAGWSVQGSRLSLPSLPDRGVAPEASTAEQQATSDYGSAVASPALKLTTVKPPFHLNVTPTNQIPNPFNLLPSFLSRYQALSHPTSSSIRIWGTV